MASPSGGSAHSRRTVLRHLGIGVGALAASTGPAAAQEQGITSRAVIPEQEQFPVEELPGFFIHVNPDTAPLKAQVSDQCEYATWPPEQSRSYDVWLIGRKANEHGSQKTTLYVADDRTIPGGALYVVNNATQCAAGYVGIQIEQLNREGSGVLGTRNAEADPAAGVAAEDGGSGDDSTGVFGPGFGVLGALSGLLGGGWLAHRRRE
ncbi:hypothetical protein ACFR9U_06890 [Halorientalis brevis]|uniref:PGF-CTERM protein n=1 Tax=Halorientalis brevis TaxID=1126241 RepID=A0ABD6C9T1_9EURY|nr:hypothetical protein [Halorientalis brevis]